MYGFLEIGKTRKRVRWNESVELTPDDATIVSDGGAALDIRYSHREYAGIGSPGPFSNKVIYNEALVSKQTNQVLGQNEIKPIETTAYLEFVPGTLEIHIDTEGTVAELREDNNGLFNVHVRFSGFSNVPPVESTNKSKPRTHQFEFADVTADWQVENDQAVLVVKVEIFNVSAKRQPIPPVRLSILDADGRELRHEFIDVDEGSLNAGEQINFTGKLIDPTEESENFRLTFSKG